MTKQFYIAYYGNILIGQTLDEVGCPLNKVIERLKREIPFSPLKDEGYSEFVINKMINNCRIETCKIGE